MKKKVIGIIFSGKRYGKDEKFFIKEAKKKNIELVFFNTYRDFSEDELERKIKRCDVIYNSSAEDFAIEYEKTIEMLGKKVYDPSSRYYYIEDKWIFYVKCKENKIPTPETILLSENINYAKEELKKHNVWPIILKRVSGTMGQYVEKANNINEAVRIMNKFWKKGSDKLPIIAQEYIASPSYRVTVINNKIVQTAIKESKGWKATGVYAEKIKKFPVGKELRNIVKKVMKTTKISVCGIDLLKRNGKWVVLEVNAEPAYDFFENEREKLIGLTLDFLKSKIKR